VESELQALVTGMLVGAMMKASLGDEGSFLIEVEPLREDKHGIYEPEFVVRGRVSGQRVRVSVEALPDEEAT
jgi:hypothetical protein